MNYSSRSNRSSSWNKGGFDRNQADRPMFKAVCSECSSRCEVPFKPNGKKPVLCSNCFKKDDRPSFGSDRPHRSDRPSFGGEKESYSVDCDECGIRTTVPFKPNGKKLVFCRDCFGKEGSNDNARKPESSGNNYQVLDQLRAINLKLDTIMKLVNKTAPKDEFDATV